MLFCASVALARCVPRFSTSSAKEMRSPAFASCGISAICTPRSVGAAMVRLRSSWKLCELPVEAA